jgi:hypothetical protein
MEASFIIFKDIMSELEKAGANSTDMVEIKADKVNPNNKQDIVEVYLNNKLLVVYNDCM